MKKYEYKEIVTYYGKVRSQETKTGMFGNEKVVESTQSRWIIKDTTQENNHIYPKEYRLIDVFNELGNDGFELVDSNQFIKGHVTWDDSLILSSTAGAGYSETEKLFYYLKREVLI